MHFRFGYAIFPMYKYFLVFFKKIWYFYISFFFGTDIFIFLFFRVGAFATVYCFAPLINFFHQKKKKVRLNSCFFISFIFHAHSSAWLVNLFKGMHAHLQNLAVPLLCLTLCLVAWISFLLKSILPNTALGNVVLGGLEKKTKGNI